MKRTFSKRVYLAGFLFLFAIECLIAFFIQDRFIRPYLGDFLVVIMIYCFLMSTLNLKIKTALFITTIIAFTVEFSQYFGLIYYLSENPPMLLKIVLGSSFSIWDLLAYSCGILCVYILEFLISRNRSLLRSF